MKKGVLILLLLAIVMIQGVEGTTLTAIPQGGSFYNGQTDVDLTSTIPKGTSMLCWWDSYGIRGTPRFQDCMYMQGQNPANWSSTGVLFHPGEYYADAAMNAKDPSIYILTFKVLARQTPVSSLTTDTTSGPAPLTVRFNDTSSNNPDQWLWDFGDGTTSYLQNVTHTYSISGVYSVSMRAGNQYSLPPRDPDSAKTTITVLSPLDPNAATTSPTTSLTQTTTTTTKPTTTTTTATTTTKPTTTVITDQKDVVTTATNTPIEPTDTTLKPTRSSTTKTTIKIPTSLPIDTPTEPSPTGIELGVIATIGAALLVIKRK